MLQERELDKLKKSNYKVKKKITWKQIKRNN